MLFGLALLLAVAVALARRSQVLAKRSASMWFDEQEDDETCAYLMVDRDLTVRAASERFRKWFGSGMTVGSSLGDLWQGKFDWHGLQASLAETYEGALGAVKQLPFAFSTTVSGCFGPSRTLSCP